MTSGGGTLTLTGTNSYTGGTTVEGGTLEDTVTGSLPDDSGPVAVQAGFTLTVQVGAYPQWTFSDIVTLLANVQWSAGAALGVDVPANANFTYAASIGDTNSGAFGLVKVGLGTLDLSGIDTYSGPTMVEEGTLIVTGGLTESPVTVTGGTLIDDGTISQPVQYLPTMFDLQVSSSPWWPNSMPGSDWVNEYDVAILSGYIANPDPVPMELKVV